MKARRIATVRAAIEVQERVVENAVTVLSTLRAHLRDVEASSALP